MSSKKLDYFDYLELGFFRSLMLVIGILLSPIALLGWLSTKIWKI